MIYCTILFSEGFDKLFEVSLEAFADLGMVKGDLAVSLHNAELIAHIISLAVEVISKQLASGAELAHNVGQVKFLTLGSLGKTLFEHAEYLGGQHDSAEDSVEGHDLVGGGLLDYLVAVHRSGLALDG